MEQRSLFHAYVGPDSKNIKVIMLLHTYGLRKVKFTHLY